MVASTLDRVKVGQRFASMPPHVTLFPWFDIDTAKFETLNRKLGEMIELDNLTIFQKDVRRQKLVKAMHLWDKIKAL